MLPFSENLFGVPPKLCHRLNNDNLPLGNTALQLSFKIIQEDLMVFSDDFALSEMCYTTINSVLCWQLAIEMILQNKQ